MQVGARCNTQKEMLGWNSSTEVGVPFCLGISCVRYAAAAASTLKYIQTYACTDAARVCILYVERNSLKGPLPLQLGNLDHLLDLRLQGNMLTGSIPNECGETHQDWPAFGFDPTHVIQK